MSDSVVSYTVHRVRFSAGFWPPRNVKLLAGKDVSKRVVLEARTGNCPTLFPAATAGISFFATIALESVQLDDVLRRNR